MADTKTFRAVGDIQAEYGRVCAQVGDAEFKITQLQTLIANYNARLKELSVEVENLPKQEAPASGSATPQ